MKDGTADLIARLKAFADPVRIRLLALCEKGECSVSELVQVTGQSQPRISQQLKQLCDARLLQRFRDGRRVFYRVPTRGPDAAAADRLLTLIPDGEPAFADDWDRLRSMRGQRMNRQDAERHDESANRALHRAILELTVTAPVGDLLDVGCGRGAILKLLANRANRAVGVDIDANARQLARAELMLAGLPHCSLRKGDMYRLPFDAAEFNTIIIDDVLADARWPVLALNEARRLLRPGGRLFIVENVAQRAPKVLERSIADWSRDAGLRVAPPRLVPPPSPVWLVTVASAANDRSEAL